MEAAPLNNPDQTNQPQPTKPEDKPFHQFIDEELIPSLKTEFKKIGLLPNTITFEEGQRPVTGGLCWMLIGQIPEGRQFWLCFESESIKSSKTISLSESGGITATLESFLVDEKKITLALITSRLLQRLNGQKWLGAN